MVRFQLVLFVVIASTSLQSQTISVDAYTDSTDYLVGDFINYNVEVITRRNVEVIPPSLPDTLDQIELISSNAPVISEDDKSQKIIYNFILAGYDSVSAVIPSIMIEYRTRIDTSFKTIETDPVIVNIHTVPVFTAEEIKDVKSPLKIPYDWIWLLLWITIALLIITAGYIFYRKFKKKQSQKPVEKKVIHIPAHIKAFRELEKLEKEQLWQKGFIKDYHSRITEIIRSYFEERFDLPALELTTTETLQHLNSIKESENILDITFDFLSNADLVKFAKYLPIESLNEEMMSQAKDIVQNTILHEGAIVEMEEVNV
jgi:hypothetical protein